MGGGPVAAAMAGVEVEGRSYAALARRGYAGNPVAHRAVRLVAEAAAAVPLVLQAEEREVPGHPLLALLARSNPLMAGPEFLETLYSHLALDGNAFVEVVTVAGEARELYPLRPDRVRIETGRQGWPEALVVETGAGPRRLAFEGRIGDPLHIRLFHPLDATRGLAPLASAAGAIALSNAATRWNRALIDNSARPSGALVYQPKEGGNLSPQHYERLKRELEEGYAGAQAAGRPLLLEGGLDWKPMSLTPRDLDFAEAKNGAARDIALSLGVPPPLLGLPGDNTYSNYQEANRAFYRLTVLPLVARTMAALVQGLTRPADRVRIDPDPDGISALSAERGELWARVAAAPFLTDAEKREALGYAPDPR
nr:phage portal protein [Gellertiella hungarica]